MDYKEKNYIPTILELKEKGFKLKYYKHKSEGPLGNEIEEIRYILEGINCYIAFNPEDSKYTWYLVTNLGESYNHIHLCIEDPSDLTNFLISMRMGQYANKPLTN